MINLPNGFNNAFYWSTARQVHEHFQTNATIQRNDRANLHIVFTDITLNIRVWLIDRMHTNYIYRERRQIHKLLVIVDQNVAYVVFIYKIWQRSVDLLTANLKDVFLQVNTNLSYVLTNEQIFTYRFCYVRKVNRWRLSFAAVNLALLEKQNAFVLAPPCGGEGVGNHSNVSTGVVVWVILHYQYTK